MNTKILYFIGILLLVCATVVAQTPSGKPNVTNYKFGPKDERHVDMNDADVCIEAGRFYYEQAFKAGSLEEASVLLNQSITLLQRALELRTKNGLPSERAVIHRLLANAFMAAAKLFPNDVRTATAYYRKAAEQYEAIIEDCQPVNDRNKETVAEAAYRMAEILFLLNDDKKVVAAAEIAWTNGWAEWEQVMIDRLNDCQRSGVATSNILPPPPKRATAASIALFPLNVLPDMVAEGFCNSYLRTSESLDMFHNGQSAGGFVGMVFVPFEFFFGLPCGIPEAWRGYPFWNTRTLRRIQRREYIPVFRW